MRRNEMIDQLKAELIEFAEDYYLASDKRSPHIIRSRADGILCLIEGLGMLPPFNGIDYEWEIE